MKLWRWDKGRQGTGYEKFTLLFSKTLECDAYILKIPKGVGIPQHVDYVPHAKHYRVNITLRGHLRMETSKSHYKVWRIGDWLSFFRPDVISHSAPAVNTDTYIFSFGWLRPN